MLLAVLQLVATLGRLGACLEVLFQYREPHNSKLQDWASTHGRESNEWFPPSTVGTDCVDGCCSAAVWVAAARFYVSLVRWCAHLLGSTRTCLEAINLMMFDVGGYC